MLLNHHSIWRNTWLKVFFILSLLVSFRAWACGTGGCTKMSDQSIPSSLNNAAAASQASPSSYTFSDTGGDAIPDYGGGRTEPLKGAIKFDPNKPSADFGALARGNSQWRAVMKDEGGSPAARQEHQSVMRGAFSGVESDEVVRPAAYQNARAAAGASRVRTISTSGE